MVSYISREKLWPDALTEDVLTVYAEGLACNNFDTRKFSMLDIMRKIHGTLFKNSAGEVGDPNRTSQLIFN